MTTLSKTFFFSLLALITVVVLDLTINLPGIDVPDLKDLPWLAPVVEAMHPLPVHHRDI